MAKRLSRRHDTRYTQRAAAPVRGGRTVADLSAAMEAIAPTWAAADWDNVGLLVGDGSWVLRRVLLAIDLTADVLIEAIEGRFDAIVAYHPPIFKAIKQLRPGRTTQEGVANAALANRIAVYSPHTALDAAPGGTNDVIAGLAGIENAEPFEAAADPGEKCKLVVFVPSEQVETVAAAIFNAGGGQIGDYSQCSFRLSGEGTFFGGEGANPAVGARGRLERVPEVRLEVIFPRTRMAAVIAAVREAHPYEEPAFDIYPLAAAPIAGHGQGRMGMLHEVTTLGALGKALARKVGGGDVSFVGTPNESLRRGFVCVGAAGSLPFEIPGFLLGRGDVVITGEIRHHDALRYLRLGASAIALGHWSSERPVLGPLKKSLSTALKGVSVAVSRRDRNPFVAIGAK